MTVKLPPLELWQKDVFEAYQVNPSAKWFTILATRQVGKSILLEILLIAASIKQPDSVSLAVSPVVAQSRKLFTDICNFASDLIESKNATILEITLINGSKILFRSAEQGDGVRGITVKKSGILVVDEAAFVPDDFFYSICIPTTNVYKSDVFIVSTPKFKQGFFYELYNKGLTFNEKIVSFDWTNYDTSKYLDEATLAIYRKELPKNSFLSEYCGRFIDGDGVVFNNFKSCIGNPEHNLNQELVIGIDWACGVGGDSTVITSTQVINKIIYVQDIIAFNNLNANQTIQRIIETINNKIDNGFTDIRIIAEQNSIGNVYYQLLNEEIDKLEQQHSNIQINCNKFLTTNSSKADVIKKIENCFEKNLIIIPDNNELIKQLSAYEAKVSNTGIVTYNAPSGLHDDYIMSLSFCVNQLYKELFDE